MLIKNNVTRRKLLESTASSILLLPLFRVFRETEAFAQSTITPRALFIYFPAGSYRASFWPQSQGGSLGTLPVVTAPLEAHKSDIIFFSGLTTQGNSNHYGGPLQVFAGWGGQGFSGVSASPYSIDQLLADRIGSNTLKRLVHLGVYSTFDGHKPVSYRENGQGQPAQDNPQAAFTDIFGEFNLPSGGSLALQSAKTQVANGKKRILDFVWQDMRKMKRILGPLEGDMFEAHVQALDDIQQEIQREESLKNPNSSELPTVISSTCGPNNLQNLIPNAGNVDPNSWPKWYHRPEPSPAINRINREMMIQAFACGVTRVGLMQYGYSDLDREFSFEGSQASGIAYHSLSHTNTPAYHNIQADIMREVATMISQMKGIKVGSHSLFDETLILTASDIGDNPNNHDGVNIPAFLAGNLGGRLKTGRMIEYPFEVGVPSSGKAWNHLLVSIAQLMGLNDVQAIGNNNFTGPLPELI